ncbi:MAG: MBL fold metallo-hydrolase [Candidatus Heimdallarchaeota archaeon]
MLVFLTIIFSKKINTVGKSSSVMKLLVLGSGQDAGVPQINCECDNCSAAQKDTKERRLGPSIAILDEEEEYCYIFDASPDLNRQIDIIKGFISSVKTQKNIPISGIFLTHAHFGHCSGLWSLGKECCDAREVMVFCSNKMNLFLKTNHPFKHLLERSNISLSILETEQDYPFENFSISTFNVPHRNEYADTIGYIIEYTKKILYLPDLDIWTDELISLVNSVDLALIDGSFYSHDELPRLSEVPHPPIKKTMELFKETNTEIYFTHFNHTNPVLQKNGKERENVLKKGFKLTYDGLVLNI